MNKYVQSIVLADRVYRLFMDSIKSELKLLHINNINSTQALILYHIGEEEVSVGDLIQRRYYLGSNATYMLKKLSEMGYIERTQSHYDGRSIQISLTPKGLVLYKLLDKAFQKYLQTVKQEGLDNFSDTLKQLEMNLTYRAQI